MNNAMENISVLISKYLDGSISSAEQVELDSVLDQNADARDLFTEEVASHNLFIEKDILDRGAAFKSFLQAEHKKTSTLKRTITTSVFVAAGIAAFITSYTLFDVDKNEAGIVAKKIEIEKSESAPEIIKTDNDNTYIIKKNEVKSLPINQQAMPTKTVANKIDVVKSEENISNKQVGDIVEPMKSVVVPSKNSSKSIASLASLFDCSNFKAPVKVTTKKSDLYKDNGKIEIVSYVKGLNFSLNGIDYQSRPTFDYLTPSTYSIWVKNDSNCIDIIKGITVDESLCTKEYQNSFSPDVEANWLIPVNEKEPFTIDIISITSAVVFNTNSEISKAPVWNGKDLQNAAMPEGLYKALVIYKGKETCIYNVTIIK